MLVAGGLVPYEIEAQSTQALEVGDSAPPISPFRWIKGGPITDFQKGKIYVIEFGATWCVPCAAAIPELSAIADQYKTEVEVMSVFVKEMNREPHTTPNPRYIENVRRYIEKRAAAIRYHVAVDGPEKGLEHTWLTSAGRTAIPYIFVIDRDGRIAWIGNGVKDVPPVIESIRAEDYSLEAFAEKIERSNNQDLDFDDNELLLIDGNGGESHDFLFRSLLTRYDGTITNPYPRYVDSFCWLDDPNFDSYKNRIQVVGRSIGELYYLAYSDTLSNDPSGRNIVTYEYPDTIKNPYHKDVYGKFWHEPVLEVSDPSPFKWHRKSNVNRYNYSLKVPEGLGSARILQNFMRRDLEGYFGFNVTVEERQMPYWKLVCVDKAKVSQLQSDEPGAPFDLLANGSHFEFKNGIMRDVIWILSSTYGYWGLDYGKLPKEDQAAFVDETGIKYNITFEFDRNWTFQQTLEYLRKHGLDVIKSTKLMKVVVIRD